MESTFLEEDMMDLTLTKGISATTHTIKIVEISSGQMRKSTDKRM